MVTLALLVGILSPLVISIALAGPPAGKEVVLGYCQGVPSYAPDPLDSIFGAEINW